MSNIKKNMDLGIESYYLEMDKEELSKRLGEEGQDISESQKRIQQFLNRTKLKYKSQVRKQKSEEILDELASRFYQAIHKNLEKPIATLIELIKSNELEVQHRNLDKLSEDEIKEIIKGKNLVDLMDELDDEQTE
ncbi:hypothetical protein ACE1ET_02450 [Saccharicrinis sp. FJH62]|uniref:hypothetical protein n=1 Tax=Saccharicrinis sp. FJH62 TaxID=3344657 RepID=UPI0035D43DB8